MDKSGTTTKSLVTLHTDIGDRTGSICSVGLRYGVVALLVVVGLSGTAQAERIYTWKDGSGRVHFSDKRPAGAEAPSGVETKVYRDNSNIMNSEIAGVAQNNRPVAGGRGAGSQTGGGDDRGDGLAGASSGGSGGGGAGGGAGAGGASGGSGSDGVADKANAPAAPTVSSDSPAPGGAPPDSVADNSSSPAARAAAVVESENRPAPASSQPNAGGDGAGNEPTRRPGAGGANPGGPAGGDTAAAAVPPVADPPTTPPSAARPPSGEIQPPPIVAEAAKPASPTKPLPKPEPKPEPKAKPKPKTKPKPKAKNKEKLAKSFLACTDVDPPHAHAHFELHRDQPYTLASWALRSDAEIVGTANSARLLTAQAYDPVQDADMITFRRGSLGPQEQLRLKLPRSVGEDDDLMLSIQWEMRFDRSFASDLNGFMNHKGIRFDDEGKRGSKDARYVEYQFRYSQTDDTAVAFPTLRLYSASAGGEGSLNPLRGLLKPMDPTFGVYDEQPGGRTAGPNKMNYGAKHHMQPPWNTFLLLPDRWIRVTSIIDFRKGEARIRTIMSDEQTNPVVVFDDPENPGDGFLADRDPSYINAIRVEFNSSQTVEFDKPKYIWVRNFIAAVDVELDHGGRPVSSTCRSR